MRIMRYIACQFQKMVQNKPRSARSSSSKPLTSRYCFLPMVSVLEKPMSTAALTSKQVEIPFRILSSGRNSARKTANVYTPSLSLSPSGPIAQTDNTAFSGGRKRWCSRGILQEDVGARRCLRILFYVTRYAAVVPKLECRRHSDGLLKDEGGDFSSKWLDKRTPHIAEWQLTELSSGVFRKGT